MAEVKRPDTPMAAKPLKVFTFKDFEDEKVVSCYSQEQVDEMEEYLALRKRFEAECCEQLATIDRDWQAKKEKLAAEYKASFTKANEEKLSQPSE